MKATRNDPVPSPPDESWAPIAGYESTYHVSTYGRVYSTPRPTTPGGLLKWSPDGHGYPRVTLVQGGKQRKIRVHLLVARTFIGDPNGDRIEVRHLNGDSGDPRLVNLAYGTHAENMRDMVAHGRVASSRKTHCPQNHPYDEANTMISLGRRKCRACNRARSSRAKR